MDEHLNTPTYSYWPVLLALAVLLIATGVVSTLAVSVFGLFLLFTAIIGWTWENRSEGEEGENE